MLVVEAPGMEEGAEELHGQVRTLNGRTYLLTYHPASAMRFPTAGKAAGEDLRTLKRLVASLH
jgi:uracil-DNA glycosylase